MTQITYNSSAMYSIVAEMFHETGVDPFNIYCQITGAPIGRMNGVEFAILWESLPRHADRDEIIDELYMRTIASMRPSPAWNFIRPFTLNRLRLHDPIRVCAYLLGRYFQPRDKAYSGLKRSLDERMKDGINRITAFQRLSTTVVEADKLREFTTQLLLLDSHFDLTLMNQMGDFPKSPLDIDMTRVDSYIAALQTMYMTLLETKSRLEKQVKLQASWLAHAGNRMAGEAATSAASEIRPKSEATIARERREDAQNMITNALRALMDGTAGARGIDVPRAAPKPMPQIGFKFKLPQVQS